MSKEKKHQLNKRPCRLCGVPFDDSKIKCPSCGQWNIGSQIGTDNNENGIIRLSEVSKKRKTERIITGLCDEAFGKPPSHGMPTTAAILISGEPGAGKSTASLQICKVLAEQFNLQKKEKDLLYIAAEEDDEQVEERAIRLGITPSLAKNILLYTMNSSTDLAAVIEHYKPGAIILDSLPGLLGDNLQAQVNICENLKAFSVQLNAPSIIINQVNKGDDAAGLMKLQHAVDITMTLFTVDVDIEEKETYEDWLEMEIDDKIRELITVKNRYGWANKSLIFAMTENGLVPIPEDKLEEEEEDE